MLNAFCPNQEVGEFLDVPGFAFYDDGLEARVVIQMHMRSGNDQVMIAMLQVG